jgi:EAL domain-containing protein (putative c-di-GMP-specific phosphodiesterase class I)
VGLAISTAVYLPFVRRSEARRHALQDLMFIDATQAILAKGQRGQLVVRRRDGIGMIARGLLADLKADLARNALTLNYQPKHDRTGRVVGVEALLRWSHASHGPISPAVAVNLSEDSGDIHQLGLWVLDQAFACKARWNAQGFEALTMSINVSPVQLSNPELPKWVAQKLVAYRLDPRTIELEITESAEIPSSELVDDILEKLTQTGVHLSMDDFGMGYSSLLYMRRFHVHAIKIDGSLTRDVLCNRTNADIIRTIVSLGQAQKADVVVEFVETLAQRDALAQMGCDLFQGHFYSPALSEERCVEYFKRHVGNAM